MEHIADVVTRSVATLARVNHVPVPMMLARPRTLPALATEFEEREALENPDIVVPLSELRLLSDEELVEVPRLGSFRFTDWSRRQMASILGLRWDRWFENANTREKAEELNRRFARATDTMRLRTTKTPHADEPGDGTLTAFVSPGYTPVRDSAIAKKLVMALAVVDSDLALIRSDLTDRTTSFVVKVGKPYRIGGPGEVGDLWGGLLVRNSGVGFASLFLSMFLHRLVCRNGMTAPIPDAVLLRRRHRALDGKKLDDLLVERFAALPGKLSQGAELLLASRDRAVADVTVAVRQLLEARRLPAKLVEPVMAAYHREPHASAFGVAQALTLAAQDMSPEVRLDLERAAGEYVARP
jgi:hypothetical protein